MKKVMGIESAEQQIKKASYQASGLHGLEHLKEDGPSIQRLPRASAVMMESINKNPLIWAEKEGCKSSPPKKGDLVDQLCNQWESRFLQSEELEEIEADSLSSMFNQEEQAWNSLDEELSLEEAVQLIQDPEFQVSNLMGCIKAIQQMNKQRDQELLRLQQQGLEGSLLAS